MYRVFLLCALARAQLPDPTIPFGDPGNLPAPPLNQPEYLAGNIKANDDDMRKLFGDGALRNVCNKVCSGTLDAWHVNADGSGHDSHISTGSTKWSGLKPRGGSKQLANQDCSNSYNETIHCVTTLSGTDTLEVSMGISKTAGISQAFSVTVGIPDIMQVSETTTFSMDVTHSKTHTDTKAQTFSAGVDVPIPTGKKACAVLKVDTKEFDSTFHIPVCIDGYFRCQYAKQCNKHYFWYPKISSYFSTTCRDVSGTARGNTASCEHIDLVKGRCPSASVNSTLSDTLQY